MKKDRKKIIILTCIFTAILALPLTTLSQESDQQPETSAGQQSVRGGLGSMFAETIQNIIRDGNVFVPNGQTAQPVQSATPGDPERFTLNFNNAQIDQTLKFLSDLTNKVVLKSDEVTGQITIMSPNEVTRQTALDIIDAAFMLKGFTFIESEEIIIVLPVTAAKQRGVNVEVGAGSNLGSRVETRIIEVKHGSPSMLRSALNPLISENASIIADDRSRTLVITDTQSSINRLVEIVNQLDKPDALQGVEIRVFKLRYLSARELSRDLDNVLENIVSSTLTVQTDSRGRPLRTNVEVLADRTTNSLIISAPKEAIDIISSFILNLDKGSNENIQQKTFTLKNGVAPEIAQSLNPLVQSRRTDTYIPVVMSDSRSNTVIVSGYPEDIETFGNIIQMLDDKQSYDQITRVYPLVNADAIILSNMLLSLVSPNSANQRNSWYGWGGRQQNQDEMRIIEDQRMNALIITAKPSQFPMIEQLIKQLDQPLPESKEEPRVYPVENVRANDIATIINQLFMNQQQGGFFYGQQQQQQLTGLSGKVKVISDPATNSLIVIAGTPRAFEVVEKLIKQLDRLSPELGSTRVYNLKNAEADYLQSKLTSLFQESPNRGGNQGFFWYLNQSSSQDEAISQLIGNVRIESETRTNSLLITTNSQYFPMIEELISELDREIAQILIEILIVEITDIKNNEIGIDWDGSIPIRTDVNFQAPLNDIGLDRVAVISNAQYDMVLNYLASSSKTNVVARPNILTGDNKSAFVEAINLIPVPDELSITLQSTSQGIRQQEVGLKLTVRPHINDASTVTVNVDLETGQVLEGFALNVEGTVIPAFSRRTVQTELTVNDMETAVLSGVIDTSFTDSERGIPLLKDIPLIGNIFKTQGRKRSNTELMAFITPYILSTPEDRNNVYLRQQERLRMHQSLNKQLEDIKIKFGVNPVVSPNP